MVKDSLGVELTPGNNGENCIGNGKHTDNLGVKIECCCDECDYLLCCCVDIRFNECEKCLDKKCPFAGKK